MLGMLQVVAGPDQGKAFFFGRRKATVGRGPANGVVLRDPTVARLHFEILWDGEQVRVTDAGSPSGTFVNGERLAAARDLQPGDVLTAGDTRLEFRWSRDDEQPTITREDAPPPGRR